MKLVIISGAEATGKSAIGMYIAKELGYKYHSKDVIKERLFDTQKVSTWNYGWYEKQAKGQFFSELAVYLKEGKDLILESNFIGKDKARLQKMLVGVTVDIVEIHCFTHEFASFKRFVRRNETKARHPGHHDRRWYIPVFWNTLTSNLKIYDAHGPVKLSGKIMYVDTTHFENVNMGDIATFISTAS